MESATDAAQNVNDPDDTGGGDETTEPYTYTRGEFQIIYLAVFQIKWKPKWLLQINLSTGLPHLSQFKIPW